MQHKDPDASLRSNVHLLGELLGDTLREQGGEALFQTVEAIRTLTREARRSHYFGELDFGVLVKVLENLSDETVLAVARAFSHFLNLANIAEEHHRIRRARTSEIQTGTFQKGSLEESFSRLLAQGVSPEDLYDEVLTLNIELVLTAHPTEITRRTLIQKYDEIEKSLTELDRVDLTEREQSALVETLRRVIVEIWCTNEIRDKRPTPQEEARWGFAVVEQVLWEAVPQFLRALDHSLVKHTGKKLPLKSIPLRFGSWMGGDRDGNPEVTADVTREVCWLGRWMAVTLFLKDIKRLRAELSLAACNQRLRAQVGNVSEPYRIFLKTVEKRLGATLVYIEAKLQKKEPPSQPIYKSGAELLEPLLLCYDSLQEVDAGLVANGKLLDTIRLIEVFGLSLLRLDIRQESSQHAGALEAWCESIGKGSYKSWNESERLTFLKSCLQQNKLNVKEIHCFPQAVQEIFKTFSTLATLPRESFGAYVISMAHEPSDVLAVMVLQKMYGISPLLRVVPLFETYADLKQAHRMMEQLFLIPEYVAELDGVQEVMIGYSDSAKDAGQLTAAWTQYQAVESLTALGKRYGIKIIFFHGRGGTVARGGTPIHMAVLSQPPGSIQGAMRVTEQGEVIRYKFASKAMALRTLEFYTAAVLKATIKPPSIPTPKWVVMMDKLSAVAHSAYTQLVHQNEQFFSYFVQVTPLTELSELTIGSRPARRTQADNVESLRAIPWIFAWNQNRLMLPVWLGVGEALRSLCEEDEVNALQEMFRSWPFFNAILDRIEMVLAKSEPRLVEYYEQKLVSNEYRALGSSLRESLEVAIEHVKKITTHTELLEGHSVMYQSIQLRNPYIDPLNVLQIELLARVRKEGKRVSDVIQRALRVTIAGIAAGMRNTG